MIDNTELSQILRKIADDLDVNNSNLTEDEMMKICELISNASNPLEKISKYQTAKLLGVNHKTVDYYVKMGYIPKGRQEVGFKEIFWYKKDILKFKEEKENKKKH